MLRFDTGDKELDAELTKEFDAHLETLRDLARRFPDTRPKEFPAGRLDRDSDLAIHRDDRTLLFVPKAQTSQWEIQLMCLRPVGNILETDGATRSSRSRARRATRRCAFFISFLSVRRRR